MKRMRVEGTEDDALTTREYAVAMCMMEGLCAKETAGKLGMQLSTVKAHRSAIYKKLKVDSATASVARLLRMGIKPESWAHVTLQADLFALA